MVNEVTTESKVTIVYKPTASIQAIRNAWRTTTFTNITYPCENLVEDWIRVNGDSIPTVSGTMTIPTKIVHDCIEQEIREHKHIIGEIRTIVFAAYKVKRVM